jgi:type III restriction enzyme
VKTRLQWSKADLAIGKGGIEANETGTSAPIILEEQDIELPDLLTELQDRTQLTRKSLVRILTESQRLDDFKKNPQQFIDLVADSINRAKRMALVDGIKYQRIGEDAYYAQELFQQEELTGYLKNMLPAAKAVYEYVVYDSGGVEKGFAEDLEKNEAVKVYAKLPGWFRAPTTPTGPCWSKSMVRSGSTSSSRRRAACSTRTCATRKAPRSNAAAPTSRRWLSARVLRHTWWRGTSTT